MEKTPRYTKTSHDKTRLPGTLYARNGRYWYKVQLPGESKPAARPLKTSGATFATTDYAVAVELAKNLYQQSIYAAQTARTDIPVSASDNRSAD